METPGSFNVGVTGGAGAMCTNDNFSNIITAGAPDVINSANKQGCGSQGLIGGKIETNILQNPIGMLGVSGTFLVGIGSNTTLTGIPDATVGIMSATDQTISKDNFLAMLTLDQTLPVSSNVSVTASAGAALVDKKVTYDCKGTCIAAGAAPFSQSQTFVLPGVVFGGAINFNPAGTPLTITVAVDEILTGSKTVNFGQPATVSTTSKISQYDTIASVTASVPLCALPEGACTLNFYSAGQGAK